MLSLPEAGVEISQFTDYSFNSNFLTPTDGFDFTIGAERIPDAVKDALRPGAAVELTVNGGVQATGYIDSIDYSVSRNGGTQIFIGGRDVLAQAVDACADPTQSLKAGQTLEDALVSLFAPFGWSEPEQFIIANDADRNVKTGSSRGTPLTKGGKKKGPKPLKSYVLHQLRPHSREGVFEFAARIANRFGLWIWATASGDQLVVSRPDFETDPFYTLRLNKDGTSNVLESSVRFDISDQPTVIVADGYSGGGEFGRSRIKSITANTAVFTSDAAFLDPWKKYPDASRVLGHAFETPGYVPRNRTLYLHDDESQTQEQLDNFVRRELALLQRKSLTARYTVEGHGQMTPDGFVPWTVDTTVRVEDDIAGLHETLYVLGRTFRKSRASGTTTTLELIRLNTISFGDPPKPIATDGNGVPKILVSPKERERPFHEEQSAK